MKSVSQFQKKAYFWTLPIILLASIRGQSAQVLSASYNSFSKKIVISTISAQWCNDPIFNLEYESSGRAVFGPHLFNLVETPLNKQLCLTSKPVIVEVEVPGNVKSHSPIGQQIVILGDDNTSVTLQIDNEED